MRRLAAVFVAIALVGAGLGPPEGGRYVQIVHAQQDQPGAPRARAPLTLLQINDVYSLTPVDGSGGLARVATLKQRVSANGHTTLLVLAGDFLSPSVASSVFKGEQMVAALNAAGLDLATFGNHEFDFGIDVLIQRMSEATWQWVVSNAIDTRTNKPVGGAAPYVVRTVGNLKVGFIGLCLTTGEIAPDKLTNIRLVDPIAATVRYLPMLRRAGVNLVVAITHLTFEDDRRLAERFPQIDLIIGGHEHFPIAATENRTLISKAGSDAKWVARIDVNRLARGTVERFYELLPITSALPDEPRTAEVVASYENRLGKELDTVVATSRVPLDATSGRIRTSETALGDLVADAMRAAANADVAIVNSGGIRGDRVYPPGPVTRRTLVQIHPFGNVVCKVAVPGRVLLQALNSGVSKLPAAAGQFPQVSGLTLRVDPRGPPGDRVRDVQVNGQRLDPNKTYTVAMPDFVLKGGDDYGMFQALPVLIGPESGDLMVTALEKYVASQRDVAAPADSRITIQ